MAQLAWQAVYDVVCRNGARAGADLCALAAADSESGRDPHVAPGDNGASHGLWQMEQGAGLGNGYSAAQLEDPDFAAAIMVPLFNANYAAGIAAGHSGEALVRYCCMETERPFGYPDLNCPSADRYVASWRTAVAALSTKEPPTMTYDPETPPERQVQSWTCSIRTATWMLKSLGGTLDAGDVQGLMVPQYVTPALGLLDGDGAGLAEVLGLQTGCPTGYRWVDWPWLQAHAGQWPIGIGSPSMYHWLAVRKANADGTLALANPAPGYDGLGDTMTEAQFNTWAPWAGVWIEVDTEQEDTLSAAERQELESLRDLKTYTDALVGEGGILPSALGTMEAAAGQSKTKLAGIVRDQCAAVRQGAGL